MKLRHCSIVLALVFGALLPLRVTAVVPGSRVTITFENLVKPHKKQPVPEKYDGFRWGTRVSIAGKKFFPDDPGFQSVIHGKAAAVPGCTCMTEMEAISGDFTLKSGHFATFQNSPDGVTFTAYRKHLQVGYLRVPDLKALDTLIKFDKTFSNIDTLGIGGNIVFDNLKIVFEDENLPAHGSAQASQTLLPRHKEERIPYN